MREISTRDGVVAQSELASSSSCEWDDHRRARNWLAVVTPDRSKPGGMERAFLKRVRSGIYEATFEAGDVLEIAADRFSSRGRRTRCREFVKVHRVNGESILIGDGHNTRAQAAAERPPEPVAEEDRAELTAHERLCRTLRVLGHPVAVETLAKALKAEDLVLREDDDHGEA